MAVSTSTTATAWSPDVTANYPGDVIPEALVMRLTTQAGTVEGDAPVVRVPVVNDDTAAVVPEGQPIPEGAPELAEAVVQTAKVAKLLRISREQWEQDGTDQRLSETAGRSLIAKADDVLLNADGTGDAPAGLLHQSIPAAGAVDTDLDVLIDAISTAQTAGATPSHILVAPDAWASLRKFKNTDTSNESLLGAGTRDATSMLLGLPVITNKAVPAGTGLILDRNDIVSAVGDVQSATSRDAYFGADQIGLRATFRFGATVVHADRHATFTVTAPTTTA